VSDGGDTGASFLLGNLLSPRRPLAAGFLLGIRVNDQTLPLQHSPNFVGVRQHALIDQAVDVILVRQRAPNPP